MLPRTAPGHVRPPRSFVLGVVFGVLLMVGGSVVINHTRVADWLVRPLLRADRPGQADVIVVLGAGVLGNCVPNMNAVRRVILASRLWREQHAARVLFTGGRPTGERCAVATVMAELADELGVPSDRVEVETASHSTQENAERSAPLLRAAGAHRVLLVTDRLHVPRAVGVFRHMGFEVFHVAVPVSQGHPDNVSMLLSGFREYLALAYYRLRGWVGPDVPL